MNAPTVPKLVKNPAHLPRVFTYLKIAESIGITFFIYMAGYVRQMTNSFTGVTLMLIVCACASMTCSFFLMHETKAVGSQMFNMARINENIMLIKSYVRKFLSASALKYGPTKVEGKGHDEPSPTKVKPV